MRTSLFDADYFVFVSLYLILIVFSDSQRKRSFPLQQQLRMRWECHDWLVRNPRNIRKTKMCAERSKMRGGGNGYNKKKPAKKKSKLTVICTQGI